MRSSDAGWVGILLCSALLYDDDDDDDGLGLGEDAVRVRGG